MNERSKKIQLQHRHFDMGSCTARDCETVTPTACPAHTAAQLPGSQLQRQEEEEEEEEEEAAAALQQCRPCRARRCTEYTSALRY